MSLAPKEVKKLVDHFASNIEDYKRQGYYEAQVRKEFIDPFFEALGWDIANKGGIAEAYKDVIHEDAIKIGGTTKAPDYCFRIGTTKKFFVEAKKPSVDISSDISPAYQLRRYAWSAKLPLSILTDFEEFAVYDCQIRPNPDDKPSTGRIMLFTYKDYIDKWEQIANIFSKEAVYKGLFDKYASEKTTKRGTTTVDKEFLAEIEGWRNELAKNIAIRNGKLSVYDLNFAVQKTIDRILFLRICEDRGIERSEQLSGLINGSRIYPRLFELFEKADEKYNSGIFHFRREKDRPEGPDELSANLKIDDDVLTQILKDLYYPRSPYEFSVMPAEILGQVYEQFLGKVIRLTESHQAKVEEKPEVKKAGGVYYTPSYIVDYIVKNTVGRLLNDSSVIPSAAEESIPNCHSSASGNPPRHCESAKGGRGNLKPLTPKQIEKLKILDPACGSGSFLIGAYQYLLDYHRDYYEKERSKYKKQIYQGKGGQWFLTIAEKKRILLNNIYGVDIDSQAAEVTKLSLLLKVLENETQESLRLFHERALPDLGNNIKCGNSLIGPDFYQNRQLSLSPIAVEDKFDDEQQRKINAFDWKKEFPEILGGKNPGFDVVIGNPPYGAYFSDDIKRYLFQKYKLPIPITDSFVLFLLQSLKLLRPSGLQSFIVPSTWLYMSSYVSFRKLILQNSSLLRVILFRSPVFGKVTVETCIEIISKVLSKNNNIELYEIEGTPAIFDGGKYDRLQKDVLKELESNLCFCRTKSRQNIFERLQKGFPSLGMVSKIICGLTPYRKGKGVPSQTQKIVDGRLFDADTKKDDTYRRYIMGRDFSRYKWQFEKCRWLSYGDWLAEPRYNAPFNDALKIVIRQTADSIIAHLDNNRFLSLKNVHNLRITNQHLSYKYLLGLLNSKLMTYWYQCLIPEKGRVFAEVKVVNVKKLPIRPIDFSKPDEVKQHDKMVSLVEEMLELHKKISKIKNPEEKTRIQRQIDATDDRIDKLVYELYGLSEEEIKIVVPTVLPPLILDEYSPRSFARQN